MAPNNKAMMVGNAPKIQDHNNFEITAGQLVPLIIHWGGIGHPKINQLIYGRSTIKQYNEH